MVAGHTAAAARCRWWRDRRRGAGSKRGSRVHARVKVAAADVKLDKAPRDALLPLTNYLIGQPHARLHT